MVQPFPVVEARGRRPDLAVPLYNGRVRRRVVANKATVSSVCVGVVTGRIGVAHGDAYMEDSGHGLGKGQIVGHVTVPPPKSIAGPVIHTAR